MNVTVSVVSWGMANNARRHATKTASMETALDIHTINVTVNWDGQEHRVMSHVVAMVTVDVQMEWEVAMNVTVRQTVLCFVVAVC